MSDQYDINGPIYQVGQNMLSFSQLLNYFIDPAYKRGNLSRISDMHVKVGRPVSLRIDDDLTPLPEGSPVDEQTLHYFLGILLSEKNLVITEALSFLGPDPTRSTATISSAVDFSSKTSSVVGVDDAL